jgi:hypothetical protein
VLQDEPVELAERFHQVLVVATVEAGQDRTFVERPLNETLKPRVAEGVDEAGAPLRPRVDPA